MKTFKNKLSVKNLNANLCSIHINTILLQTMYITSVNMPHLILLCKLPIQISFGLLRHSLFMPSSSQISIFSIFCLIFPSHRRVPMILNGIVRPTRQQFRDSRPLVTQHLMGLIYDFVFVFCPSAFLYFRVQMVVPSFSALFSYSSFQVAGYQSPFLGTIFVNEFNYFFVFLKYMNIYRRKKKQNDKLIPVILIEKWKLTEKLDVIKNDEK